MGTSGAILGCLVVATTAAAASTVHLDQNLPTSPVQVVVGDAIDLTLPPFIAKAPTGYGGGGPKPDPLPTTSDSTILPLVGSTYDADGTLHAEFEAAQAGTATISVFSPGTAFCRTATTSTTSTVTTSHSTSASTSTTSTTSTTMTTSTTSTVTTSTAPEQCIIGDPPAPQTVTVVVSAVGVQGASTGTVDVPSTGSGVPVAGVMLALVGALAGGGAALEINRRRRGRRQ